MWDNLGGFKYLRDVTKLMDTVVMETTGLFGNILDSSLEYLGLCDE